MDRKSQSRSELKFISGKRHYLLYADKDGYPYLRPIVDELIKNNLPFELIFNVDREHDVIERLSGQKMGCYLYAAGHWNMIERLNRSAEGVGFSTEEMQLMMTSGEPKTVFCSRCHKIQQAKDSGMTCTHCGLELSVSEHYSSYHKAYLGYPV
ncbi:MAG TPA: dimethylamine monooxygenase subunit DmmA family protein [Bacillales bacterium]|nr:dimethylamine monooxygenase subunit DmmA family protein [Bacillales bacterium]